MTILTKPNSGAKLCPKSGNSANVESGAIIEQVRVFISSSSSSLYIFLGILCCQQNCIAIEDHGFFINLDQGPITETVHLLLMIIFFGI